MNPEPVPLLDTGHITELREILEHEFDEMVTAFLLDAQKKRAIVALAVRQQDSAHLREAAHSMKGSARNLGAHALAEAAYVLEALARDEVWAEVPGALLHIDDCMQRTELAFKGI